MSDYPFSATFTEVRDGHWYLAYNAFVRQFGEREPDDGLIWWTDEGCLECTVDGQRYFYNWAYSPGSYRPHNPWTWDRADRR